MRLSADFSAETLQARREWYDILKVLKHEILLPARLLFIIEGDIKNFSYKQKSKDFINIKLTLKEILKGLL